MLCVWTTDANSSLFFTPQNSKNLAFRFVNASPVCLAKSLNVSDDSVVGASATRQSDTYKR